MSETNVMLSLAKVLVAAAWADGIITNEEINYLKDLLFHLKGITAQDWAQIEIYIDSPVGEAERQRLVAELEANLTSQAAKDQAIQALDHLTQMGGTMGASEQAALEEIKASISKLADDLLEKKVDSPVERICEICRMMREDEIASSSTRCK